MNEVEKGKWSSINKSNRKHLKYISKNILDRLEGRSVNDYISSLEATISKYEERMKKFKAIVEANNLGHFFK